MSVAVSAIYPRRPAEQKWMWFDVCAVDDLSVNCGSAALIADRQVALVRVAAAEASACDLGPGSTSTQTDAHSGGARLRNGEEIFALSNFDPFSEAFVIARGIVGDRGGRLKIASPMYKQSFDLRTGVCLDDPSVVLSTYPVRMRDGRVQVGVESEAAAGAEGEAELDTPNVGRGK